MLHVLHKTTHRWKMKNLIAILLFLSSASIYSEEDVDYFEFWPTESPIFYVNSKGDGHLYTNGHMYKFYDLQHAENCVCEYKSDVYSHPERIKKPNERKNKR